MAVKMFSCLVILTSAYGMSVQQSCTIDNDCTHPGMYCYESGRCVECTDCKTYNREPGNVCAKEKNQCGACLPGMEKVENVDGTFSCGPSGTIQPSTHAPAMEDSTTLYIILGSVGLAMFFIIVVLVCLFRKYSQSKTLKIYFSPILSICPSCLYRCEPSPHPADPPPYSERPCPMATAPPYDGPPLTQTVTRYVESDPNQTANAYCNPQYVRRGHLATNDDPDPEDIADDLEPAEDDALINQTSISHPDDEVTQPSTWSPTNRPENTIATGPTTFTNVLGLSGLRISQPDVHQISINNRSNPSLSQQDSRSSSQPSIEFVTQNQQETSNDGNTHISIDLGLRINATVSKETKQHHCFTTCTILSFEIR